MPKQGTTRKTRRRKPTTRQTYGGTVRGTYRVLSVADEHQAGTEVWHLLDLPDGTWLGPGTHVPLLENGPRAYFFRPADEHPDRAEVPDAALKVAILWVQKETGTRLKSGQDPWPYLRLYRDYRRACASALRKDAGRPLRPFGQWLIDQGLGNLIKPGTSGPAVKPTPNSRCQSRSEPDDTQAMTLRAIFHKYQSENNNERPGGHFLHTVQKHTSYRSWFPAPVGKQGGCKNSPRLFFYAPVIACLKAHPARSPRSVG